MKFRIFRLRGDITQNGIQAILKVLVSKEFGRIFGKELGETSRYRSKVSMNTFFPF